MSFPLSLTPKARSSFPKICWFGTAFPASYSLTWFVKYMVSVSNIANTVVSIGPISGKTYNLWLFVDQLSQILLGQTLLATSLLDGLSNGNVDLWWGGDIVLTIQLGDTSVVGVSMASVSNSYKVITSVEIIGDLS